MLGKKVPPQIYIIQENITNSLFGQKNQILWKTWKQMHFFNLYVWSANYSDFSKVWQMKLIGNILHPGPQHKNFPGNLSFGNKSPFNLGIDLFPQRQGWLSHLSGHLHVCNMTVVPVSLSGLNHLIQQHFFGGRIFWWEYLPKGAPRDSQQALSFWWWGKAVCHQTYPLFLMDGLKSKSCTSAQ